MTERNSFKLLAQEEEQLNIPPPELERDIFDQLHILSIFGKTVEMYLPGAINLFVDMLGGKMTPQSLEEPELPKLENGSFNEDEDLNLPGGSTPKA